MEREPEAYAEIDRLLATCKTLSAEVERLRCDLREIHSLLHSGEDLWSVGNQIHAIARAALEGDQ